MNTVVGGKKRYDILKERFVEVMEVVANIPGPVSVGVVLFSDSPHTSSTSAIVDTMADAQGLISFVLSSGPMGGTDYGLGMSMAVSFFNARQQETTMLYLSQTEFQSLYPRYTTP
jgi:hypothetical protein